MMKIIDCYGTGPGGEPLVFTCKACGVRTRTAIVLHDEAICMACEKMYERTLSRLSMEKCRKLFSKWLVKKLMP